MLRLAYIIGINLDSVPSVSSHYEFINRLIDIDEKPRVKLKRRKPVKKLDKNQKMPNKHSGIVERFVNKILCGRSLSLRPERFIQKIFADVCVASSVDLGIVPKTLDIAGDGTCIKTKASPVGRRVCN